MIALAEAWQTAQVSTCTSCQKDCCCKTATAMLAVAKSLWPVCKISTETGCNGLVSFVCVGSAAAALGFRHDGGTRQLAKGSGKMMWVMAAVNPQDG